MTGGPRPAHLGRRGAVYFVRFRLRREWAARLGIGYVQRSLFTKDLAVAKLRCLEATAWFRAEMQRQGSMTNPTRQDFETAAQLYFERLKSEVDQPRSIPHDNWDAHIAEQIEEARKRIEQLDNQLLANQFDGQTSAHAADALKELNLSLSDMGTTLQTIALQLAAKAEREQLRYLEHQLVRPHTSFKPDDELFARSLERPPNHSSPVLQLVTLAEGESLADAGADYLRTRQRRGLGASSITEFSRALGWMKERLGENRTIGTIAQAEMRVFRDDLVRIDGRLQGRKVGFADRLTNSPEHQIKSVTAKRYWTSVRGFFAWCVEEGLINTSPAGDLKLHKVRTEVRDSPEPFNKEEIVRFFSTPLYTGYKSAKRVNMPGELTIRNAYWWSGVLSLMTGLRAGELAQLLPEDFVFDDPIPHLKVREVNAAGERVKTTKTSSSIRDVPLASDLIRLGIAQFVAARHKSYPKQRLFHEFRLGSTGRKSEGLTRFWGDYLRRHGLWKDGRATHVARHTVAASLLAAGVSDDDIGAVFGHAGRTVTASYGGALPLKRKAEIVEKLNYGVDLVELLGGPYDPVRHR